jgi:integrase
MDLKESIMKLESKLKNLLELKELKEVLPVMQVVDLRTMVSKNYPNIKYTNRAKVGTFTDLLFQDMASRFNEEEGKLLLELYHDLVEDQTEKIAYKKTRYGELRKIIKTRFGEDSDIYKYTFQTSISREEHKEHHEEQEEIAQAKRRGKTQLQVEDLKTLFKKCRSSNNLYDQIITAMLATGSRMIEILNPEVSQFSAGFSGTTITIEGLAKTKEKVIITRPVLWMDPIDCILLIEKIRNSLVGFDGLTNTQMTSLIEKPLNKRILEHNCGVTSSHDLRKSYACILYNKLEPEEKAKITQTQFIQDLLGHTDIRSSERYSTVNIVEKEKKKVVKRIQPINEVDSDEVLLKDRNGNKIPFKKKGKVSRKEILELLVIMAQSLSDHNVLVSDLTMKKLGFSSNTLSRCEEYKNRKEEWNHKV